MLLRLEPSWPAWSLRSLVRAAPRGVPRVDGLAHPAQSRTSRRSWPLGSTRACPRAPCPVPRAPFAPCAPDPMASGPGLLGGGDSASSVEQPQTKDRHSMRTRRGTRKATRRTRSATRLRFPALALLASPRRPSLPPPCMHASKHPSFPQASRPLRSSIGASHRVAGSGRQHRLAPPGSATRPPCYRSLPQRPQCRTLRQAASLLPPGP